MYHADKASEIVSMTTTKKGLQELHVGTSRGGLSRSQEAPYPDLPHENGRTRGFVGILVIPLPQGLYLRSLSSRNLGSVPVPGRPSLPAGPVCLYPRRRRTSISFPAQTVRTLGTRGAEGVPAETNICLFTCSRRATSVSPGSSVDPTWGRSAGMCTSTAGSGTSCAVSFRATLGTTRAFHGGGPRHR